MMLAIFVTRNSTTTDQ